MTSDDLHGQLLLITISDDLYGNSITFLWKQKKYQFLHHKIWGLHIIMLMFIFTILTVCKITHIHHFDYTLGNQLTSSVIKLSSANVMFLNYITSQTTTYRLSYISLDRAYLFKSALLHLSCQKRFTPLKLRLLSMLICPSS